LPWNVRLARTLALLWLALLLALAGCGTRPDEDGVAVAAPERGALTLYATRDETSLATVLRRFSHETGIAVRVTTDEPGALLDRLRGERGRPQADALLADDAGSLGLAAAEGLLQPVASTLLEENVPEELRDAQGRWFALSQRLYAIAYDPARVEPADIPSYESLGDARWRGRLCLRPRADVATVALASGLIGSYGPERAAAIVGGWIANAPQVLAGEAQLMQALATGSCDVALVGHGALGSAQAVDPLLTLRVAWPDQFEGAAGAQRDISGIGVVAGAPNAEQALELAEWLSAAGQAADRYGLPGGSYEFPINPLAAPHPYAAAIGRYRAAPLPLAEHAALRDEAEALLERIGYP
jgi:iron(III) transport system substrate-binding protein